jgi:hypothetical protein
MWKFGGEKKNDIRETNKYLHKLLKEPHNDFSSTQKCFGTTTRNFNDFFKSKFNPNFNPRQARNKKKKTQKKSLKIDVGRMET